MIDYYLAWYLQAKKAYEQVCSIEVPKNYLTKVNSIVFVGMGGSGIVGDFVVSLAHDKLGIPVFSIKDYRLPSWINEDTLVISVSYSGNTRETILATLEALKKKSKVVMISSGGVLKSLSAKYSTLHISVEGGLVPRAALPSMLYTVLAFLERISLPAAPRDDIIRSIENLKLWCNSSEVHSESKGIADFLSNSIPIIVSCFRFSPLAYRLKNELNENSKIPAKVEVVPEWGHNDIVGWEMPVAVDSMRCLVLDCGEDMCRPILDFAGKSISNAGVKCRTLELKGESTLDKFMYGSFIGGLASVYLAKSRNVNPIETRSISEYKKLITKLININIV